LTGLPDNVIFKEIHFSFFKMTGGLMKDGKCPRCGSADIYSGSDLPLKGGPFSSNSIPISLTSMAPLDNYVCSSCGLVESYIADEKKLKEIMHRWKPINASNDNKNKK
jgi:predicted nucleic-acid-binding Zn-ribbon protein